MPGIREQLSITDGFSQTFRAFQNAADSSTRSADGLGESITDLGNNDGLERLISSIDRASSTLEEIANSQKKVTDETKKTADASGDWLSKIKNVAASLGAMKLAQGFIEEADAMSQMTAKLGAINDGLQTTDELNKMIFASAQRSRGSYKDTADLVARLGMNAGEAFSTNQEQITFAENLNKSFKIAGASAQEQASVILQLSQALAGGALRGQEFNAVMSGAPNVIRQIADYMGEPIGAIRDLASEGKITADVVKNALIAATDDINAQFEQMPQTWGDIIQNGKNYLIFGLQEAFADWTAFINTEQFQEVMNILLNAVIVLARTGAQVLMGIANAVIWVKQNWETLQPVIMAAVAGMIAYKAASLASAVVSAAAWAVSHWWILAIGMALVQVIQMASKVGISFEEVGGIIGVVFGGVYAIIHNIIANIWNVVAEFVEFFANAFNDPIGSIVRLFTGLADVALGVIERIARAMDWVFGSNMGDTVAGWRDNLQAMVDAKYGEAKYTVERMDYLDFAETAQAGGDMGAKIAAGIEDIASGLTGEFNALDEINSQLSGLDDIALAMGSTGEIANVGTVGAVKGDVNLADEDVKILRDLAEMKYMQKVELKTLAPEINVSIPESAAGTLSNEDVAEAIRVVLIEQEAAHTATSH